MIRNHFLIIKNLVHSLSKIRKAPKSRKNIKLARTQKNTCRHSCSTYDYAVWSEHAPGVAEANVLFMLCFCWLEAPGVLLLSLWGRPLEQPVEWPTLLRIFPIWAGSSGLAHWLVCSFYFPSPPPALPTCPVGVVPSM